MDVIKSLPIDPIRSYLSYMVNVWGRVSEMCNYGSRDFCGDKFFDVKTILRTHYPAGINPVHKSDTGIFF